MPEDAAAPVALLSRQETCRARGGCSDAQLYRDVRAGLFPAPIVLKRDKLGRPRRIAWVDSEVRTWIQAQIDAERNGR